MRDRPSLPGLNPSLTGSIPSSRSQLLSGGFQRVACYALFCTGQSTPSLLIIMCIPVLLGMLKKSSLLCDICVLLFFYVALTGHELQVRVWYNSLYRTYFSASIMYHDFLKIKLYL